MVVLFVCFDRISPRSVLNLKPLDSAARVQDYRCAAVFAFVNRLTSSADTEDPSTGWIREIACAPARLACAKNMFQSVH